MQQQVDTRREPGHRLRVGDNELSRDKALLLLQEYAVSNASTVLVYDLAGDPEGRPGPDCAARPVDSVDLADIGRLVAINARLAARDPATLTSIDAAAEFAAVAPDARIENCEPGSDLYAAATGLYEKYRLHDGSNIGQAKRSKLLHIKRPWLVPIADSRSITAYRQRAGIQAGRPSRHWEAVREDLITGAEHFEWLTAQLGQHPQPEVQRLGRLTRLRLLDILAWTLGGPEPPGSTGG